jgi:outer membrane protein insertion porin family
VAANGTFTRDRRNSIFYPTLGDYFNAGTDLGYVTRGSSENSGLLFRPFGEWRVYRPLTATPATQIPTEAEKQKVRVLATRVMGGVAVGSVPFFEKFFVGGSNSLRGYLEDRFWGKYMVLGNVEYRFPLFGNFIKACFSRLFFDV